MKNLNHLGLNHADRVAIAKAIEIIERIAFDAEDNATKLHGEDSEEVYDLHEMNESAVETADRAVTAIIELLYVIDECDHGYDNC